MSGRFGVFLALLLVALPAGAGPLPPAQAVDEKQVCLECHDLAAELAGRVPHAPAVEGQCSACHSPHVSRFDGLLRAQPGPLCARCHEGVAEELERAYVHAPVAEGRCAECHPPHGGEVAGLLAKPPVELCASCHSEVSEWKGRPVAHAPFAQGRCGTCHDPHASSRRGLLRETVHEPFAGGDCATCHVGRGAANPFALVRPEAELCGDCHTDQVEASLAAPFPHVSAGGGACTACHNPHAGEGVAMLQRKGDDACLACHDPGGASSGQPGRFARHAGEVGCATCHAPHGSDRPLLFVADPVQVCGDCHSHQHGVTHPLGEKTLDPRSGAPMDCGSCHAVHHAPYDKYLHAGDVRDLCVSCHKGMARRNR